MIITVNFKFEQLERRSPKKSGLQRDSNPWPPRYQCHALPTELWSHTLTMIALHFHLQPLKNLNKVITFLDILLTCSSLHQGAENNHNGCIKIQTKTTLVEVFVFLHLGRLYCCYLTPQKQHLTISQKKPNLTNYFTILVKSLNMLSLNYFREQSSENTLADWLKFVFL